ncbi:MAG TPA: hypothetical protein VIF11_15850 [Methylomirabilota bacterium]|jgi:hypothetical protein
METPAVKPGSSTSEFKLALLSIAATVGLTAIKGLGVAVAATGQWWAVPVSLGLTSLGYSLSRGLAKRGVTVTVTDGEPAKNAG